MALAIIKRALELGAGAGALAGVLAPAAQLTAEMIAEANNIIVTEDGDEIVTEDGAFIGWFEPEPITITDGPDFESFVYGPVIEGAGRAGATLVLSIEGEGDRATVVNEAGEWSFDLIDITDGALDLVFAQSLSGLVWPVVLGTLEVTPKPAWVLDEATFDYDYVNERGYVENDRNNITEYDDATLLNDLTFTRASSATYFDSAGVLQTAASNVLRFDHDPVTLAPRGLLIEGARTNLCTYSNDIANAAWAKTDASVTDDAGVSKDGTTNADFVVEAATTANHFVLSANASFANATTYTFTAIAKSTNRCLQIELGSPRFGSNAWANFDLINGAVGTVGSSATARIEPLGGGWYRCHITATTTSSGNGAVRCSIVTAAASAKNQSYAGDGTSGLFLTFVQVEAGAFASSYIATTAAAATRAADVLTAAVGGWFNPSEGTLVAEYSVPAIPSDSAGLRAAAFTDGTTSNLIGLRARVTGGNAQSAVVVEGVAQASIAGPALLSDTVYRQALAFKANDFAASINGTAPTPDVSGAIPSVTTLELGKEGGAYLYGHLRRVSYIPRRVSNAELQALSA